MKLNEIADNARASRSRMRVGRGIGSGKGKTCGRGVKGQKARTGVAIKGFEGGQMPLHRRLPKRGFWNPFSIRYNEVNLGRVQAAVDAGKLDAAAPVTIEALIGAGVCAKPRDGVKILGKGALAAKLVFEVAAASKSAVAAIEGAGGSIVLLNKGNRGSGGRVLGSPQGTRPAFFMAAHGKKRPPPNAVALNVLASTKVGLDKVGVGKRFGTLSIPVEVTW